MNRSVEWRYKGPKDKGKRNDYRPHSFTQARHM